MDKEVEAGKFALYHVDVYVTQLMLNKETYIDTNGVSLLAKVVFINFPALQVAERSRFHKNDVNDIYVYEFNGGQTFHFSMVCDELVKKMKRVPLYIGIFRIDDHYPICQVRTNLSGCACDLGTLLVEKPTPFVFRGPFDLVDPGNSFAGRLGLDITITNMGRYLITRYALGPNCFVFKSNTEEAEYECNYKEASIGLNGLIGDNSVNIGKLIAKLDTASPGSVIRDMAGISPAANHLARGRPPVKPPREPLVDPLAVKRSRRRLRGKKRGKKK